MGKAVQKINDLEDSVKALSDEEMLAKTAELAAEPRPWQRMSWSRQYSTISCSVEGMNPGTISPIPFNGPIGAARVGYIDGEYVLNPNLVRI